MRLREAGIHVWCFAQAGKAAGEELAKVYEQVVYLDAPAPTRAARPVRKTAAKKATAAKPVPPRDPVHLALAGLPGFEDGAWVEMNEVVKALRDAKLLSKSASGPRFLAKNAPYVELTPAAQPNKVRLKTAR